MLFPLGISLFKDKKTLKMNIRLWTLFLKWLERKCANISTFLFQFKKGQVLNLRKNIFSPPKETSELNYQFIRPKKAYLSSSH